MVLEIRRHGAEDGAGLRLEDDVPGVPASLRRTRSALLQRRQEPMLDEGVVGRILTDFLKENVEDGFPGSLADWERALESLHSSLADLPDCRIPLAMLQVAVRYTKTGDERHLLSLPLEQRQLLEGAVPPSAGERVDRA